MLDVVTALAWDQHGAFSTAQAEGRGVARSSLTRRCRDGVLLRRAQGVYALAVAPRTARQDLMVHLLAAGDGAFATDDSALALWCPELVLPAKPVIVVPRSCGYRTRQAIVRRGLDTDRVNPGVVDGIPTVGVARALLDASIGRSPDEVLSRIDACRRHGSLATGALLEVLDQHARRGRPGIVTFRQAVRGLRREVTDSEFERLVIRDLVAAGLPAPRLHHVVRLPGEGPIELDLDWPGLLLDVELDGADHKERARRMARDRKRDRLLQAAGYLVARYTWDDYVADRAGMIAEIVELRAAARRS
ncbi:MAG TPA: type IV toxin-antitoxin system AbiEi family antitoxin domain-containing protein [Acidimicrobiales bacterium]|nr:type IV toxin-antitoxin system AbiEi family antitoxin domain-containing protein [Acidimicrobiales bacterium]